MSGERPLTSNSASSSTACSSSSHGFRTCLLESGVMSMLGFGNGFGQVKLASYSVTYVGGTG